MKIVKATRLYEDWIARFLRLDSAALKLKHEAMAEREFPFFRATFYRWMQVWPEVCKDLDDAPKVMAVGDIHVENYGTWRDNEGRLIWGVNDFDEVSPLPYTLDLVRLAASAHLAIGEGTLSLTRPDACDSILEGYGASLKAGGGAYVLAEQHEWLWATATERLRNPEPFWAKLTGFAPARQIPERIRRQLLAQMPKNADQPKYVRRLAGLGSLGRQRFVAIANLGGGLVAREAKALAPSAVLFALGKGGQKIRYNQVLKNSVRCRDPFVREIKGWLYRRLAPDCSRIELASLKKERDEARLLYAMGWELGNVHLSSPKSIAAVRRDLSRRKAKWLHNAAAAMTGQVAGDFAEWKKEYASKGA